jgi:hypothetical protein
VDRFAREDVMQVLSRYGSAPPAERRTPTVRRRSPWPARVSTKQLDVDGLTRALMYVLPHMKVWVAPDSPRWSSEPI